MFRKYTSFTRFCKHIQINETPQHLLLIISGQVAAKQPPSVPTEVTQAMFMLMIHARASSPDPHARLSCPGTCTECMFHKFKTRALTGLQIIPSSGCRLITKRTIDQPWKSSTTCMPSKTEDLSLGSSVNHSKKSKLPWVPSKFDRSTRPQFHVMVIKFRSLD